MSDQCDVLRDAILAALTPERDVEAVLALVVAHDAERLAAIEALPRWAGMAAPGGGQYLHLLDRESVLAILRGTTDA